MAGITVLPSDLETITGEPISDEQAVALDRLVRALISSAYSGNLDTVQGHASRVLTAVYTAVALRLLTNPTGVSLISAGNAQISYGGASEAYDLTKSERARLAALRGRKPTYVVLGPGPLGVPWRN